MAAKICRPVVRGDHINVIFKLTGSTCNLDCGYCFEKRREYPIHGTIDERLVTDVLAMLDGNPISVELHGGEPMLLGVAKMKSIVDAILKIKPNCAIRMQTNATLMSQDWCDFLIERPEVSIGISLDGFGDGNSFRYDNREEASTEAVLAGIAQLEANSVDYGLICVATQANKYQVPEYLDNAANLRHVKTVRFLPCFDTGARLSSTVPRTRRTRAAFDADGKALPWAISFSEFAKIITDAYNHWKSKDYYEKFLLDPAIDYLKKALGGGCATCHFQAKKCFHTVTIFPDETFSLCDELDGGERFSLLAASGANPVLDVVEGRKRAKDPMAEVLRLQCEACDIRDVCSGGCPAIRQRYHAVGQSEEYCSMQKELFAFFRSER